LSARRGQLVRRPASRDIEHAPGSEAALWAPDPCNHGCNLFDRTEPAHRNAASRHRDVFGCHLLEKVCLGHDRRHTVNRDADRRELARKRLRESDHTSLRRTVRSNASGALLTGDRRYVHDSAVPSLAHMRNYNTTTIEDAGQVD